MITIQLASGASIKVLYFSTPASLASPADVVTCPNPEAKLKISLSKLGKPRSDGVKLNLSKLNSGINNPFYGKMHSPETLIQMRVSRRTIICPHCFKEGGANVMHKHHFDNCHLMVGKKSFGPYKRTDFICPHCLKEGAGPNMKRYHFDNCKFFKE